MYPTFPAKEFQLEISSPNVYLLDVRTPEEYAEAHLAGAHNLDVTQDDFESKAIASLPKDKTIAVYCRSGKRSAMAADKLEDAGFHVINLEGGITAWSEAGLPVTK